MKRLLQRTLISLSFFFSFAFVRAQETTSTLSGVITDTKGAIITCASIVAKHEPTGFTSGTQSNSKGIFIIPNLKPGGPYTITISFTGLATETLNNINLNLGNNPDANVTLKADDKSLKEVVVTVSRKGIGSGLTVGRTQMNTLPSIGRSLADFIRLTLQSNNNSFAGTNFRSN